MSTRPMSSRGYVMGARTAPRFQRSARTVTPGPGAYRPFPRDERRCQPARVPFFSSTPRFPARIPDQEFYPGPGTYNIEQPLTRRVTWPMKFGAPDWATVAALPQRMVKLQIQKELSQLLPADFWSHSCPFLVQDFEATLGSLEFFLS
ncbi:ciliary microtubule-associated protein 3 [Cyanocitta cristata]